MTITNLTVALRIIPNDALRLLAVVGPFLVPFVTAQDLVEDQQMVVPIGKSAPGGGKFGDCQEPVLGTGGHIAFVAKVEDLKQGNKAIFVGKPGSLRRLALRGEPVPGGPDEMVFKLDRVSLWVGPWGETTFLTNAENEEGEFFKAPRCLLAGAPRSLETLAVQGFPMPDSPEGFVFDRLDATARDGITVLSTHPRRLKGVTPDHDSSVMAAKGGKVITLFREGARPEGVSDPRATLNDLAGEEFALGGEGFVVVNASLGGVEDPGTAKVLLGVRPGKAVEVLVRAGSPSPEPGWLFHSFEHPRPDQSGAVLFQAELRRPEGSGRSSGFFFRDPTGKMTTVIKSGDPAGGAEGTIKGTLNSTTAALSGANGFALIEAELEEPPRGQSRGLWRWSEAGAKSELVALEGMAAPGLPEGHTFKKVRAAAINSAGQIALWVEVEAERRSRGIWAGTPGKLQLVAFDGASIKLSGKTHTMSRVSFAEGGTAGVGAGLGEEGELVYAADLSGLGTTVLLAEFD